MMKLLALTLVLMSSCMASAEVAIDLDAFYYSDKFAYGGTSSTYSRLMWDFSLGMALGKKSGWVLAWSYDSMSFEENPGTDSKLAVSDMGPKLSYYFNKDRTWVVAFTYDLITKGKYATAGSETVELRGSAMKVDLGYAPEIAENILLGAKLSYYKPSFNESVLNTTITKDSNSRAVIYPTLSVTFRID